MALLLYGLSYSSVLVWSTTAEESPTFSGILGVSEIYLGNDERWLVGSFGQDGAEAITDKGAAPER
jgi:hypothetical protein